MQRIVLFLLTLVTFTGCQREYSEFIKYRDDGHMKPRVALLPIIDHSPQQLPWNVSEEFTLGMRNMLMKEGNLYLTSPVAAQRGFELALEEEWMGNENLEAFRVFSPEHDFVVVMELSDHKSVPYERQKIRPVYPAKGEISSVLMMTLRLKVVDIRQERPKVILNQYIHSYHLVPVKQGDVDYRKVPWQAETYFETPVGRAHARLERDVVAQLERYITYHAQ